MVIGINVLFLIPGVVGGTETYARALLPLLAKYKKTGDQLVVFTSRETAPTLTSLSNLKVIALPFYSQNRLTRILFEQLLLPFYCFFHKVDLLLSLGYSSPFISLCPRIVTIHDLNWHYHPEDFSFAAMIVSKWLTQLSLISSSVVITDSKATKRSLIDVLNIQPGKIKVIYLGFESHLDKKLALPNSYLLSVLSHYPHKNFTTLIKVFKKVHSRFPALHLVICGTGTSSEVAARGKYLASLHDKYIHQLSRLSPNELSYVYHHAKIFVFPSAYEGFGLPVLEAMGHGIPVISSNAFSLNEIISDAGITVDPYDIQAYVDNIQLLLLNKDLYQTFSKRGLRHSQQFTWTKCAKQTLALIKKVYETKS